MAEVAWTDRFAAPFDDLRRATLLAAFRNRPLRTFFSSRDRRIVWLVGVHACAAFALTVLFPAPLLVLLPLLLGVPHVLADVRYLVLRRAIGSRARASVLVGCGAIGAVNAFALLGAHFDVAKAEVATGTLAIAVVGLVALTPEIDRATFSGMARGALVLGVVGLLGWAGVKSPRGALVVLIHAHNVVAIVAWLWLFRARIRSVLPALTLVALAVALLVSGTLVPVTLRIGLWRAFGTNLLAAADWLAPGVPGALGVGLAASFIFLQSVHYLIWLVLVPLDERPGSGLVSFRRRFREFAKDLGAPGAGAALVTWAAVLVLGATAPLATRNAYLALASFHVWLELEVLVFYAVRGRTQTGGSVPA